MSCKFSSHYLFDDVGGNDLAIIGDVVVLIAVIVDMESQDGERQQDGHCRPQPGVSIPFYKRAHAHIIP